MMYVEWFDHKDNKLCLSRIPLSTFIYGLFTGYASLLRWHKNGKRFAYWVPWWKVSYEKST